MSAKQQQREIENNRQRVVFYTNGNPESLEIMDKFNIWYVTSHMFRTKSDAFQYLLKKAFEKLEEEKKETNNKTVTPK